VTAGAPAWCKPPQSTDAEARVLGRVGLGAFFAWALSCSGPACAQVGVSASLESDYLFRGVSLSNGDPILTAGVSYDHSSGAYGGVTAIGAKSSLDGVQALGYVAYLGYAHRLKDGGSWDLGVTNTENAVYLYKRYASNYTEIHAGYSRNGLATHIYFSPRGITEDRATLYSDIDDAIRPARRWRLFAHAGVLMVLGEPDRPNADRVRADVRLGVAREFDHGEIHVSWSGLSATPYYPEGWKQKRSTVSAGVSLFF
jgi:uncharacterized protein (TIGR02001 family)